ncbi:MAG: hypothetical protein GXY38_02625 [Planctomycetes bacterium]|jgi:hypothetical protein|nr:hypothetical protein [Planctomycetota bacterium]
MTATIERTEVIDWLMEGDPTIRWQMMRDILGKPASQWKREQAKVATEGWGRQLLDCRDPAGTWGGGLYTPKWTSANYTLLLLRDMGLPRSHPAGRESARLLLGRMTGETFRTQIATLDLCIVGMYLSLNAYFGVRDDRVEMLAEQVVQSQMPDGGWNCAGQRHVVNHSSLHTTINVLDGLADYVEYGGKKAAALVAEPIRRAHEFILEHRLFKSDKTGEVIKSAFTEFSFPPRWHWDVLRGLDHLRRMDVRDERLQDAINLLLSKRSPDGRWKLENHHKGKEFFKLERPGQPSRWNTLRALRVLIYFKT